MNEFLGSYVHQVDEKGRLSLPASYRRAVEEGPLVVMQVDDESLVLYPSATWQEFSARLVELRRKQPEYRKFILDITSRAVEVVPDKQGRILMPARLLQAIGIGDSAMLVGAIDRIEVWDPERFEGSRTERTPELDRLAQEVFA